IKMRFVNITSLSALGIGNTQCRVLRHEFTDYFTEDKPVIVNFHGYPQTIKQILFDYARHPERFTVHGYVETGSTTTPFDMMVRNKVDRFHLAMEAFAKAAEQGVIGDEEAQRLISGFQEKLAEHRAYVLEHGEDIAEITNWVWEQR
ncbi:MAG: phosphoketolase family protein, partial [Candidatus Kaiserbacteria bacterium]|nr:phosphoketolase family protein [Candidatus Kaiserbacteria bacterium]